MEFLDGNPSYSPFSINGLAVKNIKGELEMRIGLVESPDRLFYFDIHSHFFLDVVS